MNPRILAAPALVLLLGACTVDNNASVSWGPICAPNDDCAFDGECGAETLAPLEFIPGTPGTLGSLHIFVQVDNQRADNSNEGTGNTNTATAYLRELELEYSNGLPTTAIPVSYQAPANSSTVVYVQIPLPGVTAGQLVTVRIRALGVYGDEREFETAALEVPIRICSGTTCLLAGACISGFGCPVPAGQSPIACVDP
jgi:hypothetical protein